MLRIVIRAIYPLMMAANAVDRLAGRDPLRLRPSRAESYWRPRRTAPDAAYFSESADTAPLHPSCARPLVRIFVLVSRLRMRSRTAPGIVHDRNDDIPDEIYTLW